VGLVADPVRDLDLRGLLALAGFARFCQAYGIRPGVGRTEVCWDTAAAESSFADPKNEMNCWQAFPDGSAPSILLTVVGQRHSRL
jgi:hypothetical protein